MEPKIMSPQIPKPNQNSAKVRPKLKQKVFYDTAAAHVLYLIAVAAIRKPHAPLSQCV